MAAVDGTSFDCAEAGAVPELYLDAAAVVWGGGNDASAIYFPTVLHTGAGVADAKRVVGLGKDGIGELDIGRARPHLHPEKISCSLNHGFPKSIGSGECPFAIECAPVFVSLACLDVGFMGLSEDRQHGIHDD